MSERDDKLLAEHMAKLREANEELSGDEDSEEEEDTGMGEVDVENAGITEWNSIERDFFFLKMFLFLCFLTGSFTQTISDSLLLRYFANLPMIKQFFWVGNIVPIYSTEILCSCGKKPASVCFHLRAMYEYSTLVVLYTPYVVYSHLESCAQNIYTFLRLKLLGKYIV